MTLVLNEKMGLNWICEKCKQENSHNRERCQACSNVKQMWVSYETEKQQFGWKDSPFKFVIAIDFGTHGTSVGYAVNKKIDLGDEGVKILTEWNERNLLDKNLSGKTKTSILLKPKYGCKDEYETIAFGNVAHTLYINDPTQNDWMLFEQFKMHLFQKDLGDPIAEYLSATNGKKIKAKHVFIHALCHIIKKALETISRAIKGTMNGIALSDVKWALTVPAIYTDTSKELMYDWMYCALMKIQNGFTVKKDQILICLEPECASLSILSKIAQRNTQIPKTKNCIKTGTKFMLVDLGGGTADICLHKVTDKASVSEISASSGDDWVCECGKYFYFYFF